MALVDTRKIGRKGGKARMTTMTAEERRAISRLGGLAKARNAKQKKGKKR